MAGVAFSGIVCCTHRQVVQLAREAAYKAKNLPNFSLLKLAALVPPAGTIAILKKA